MAVEEKIKEILKEVLDVSPEEITPDAPLDQAFGVDSTEMVEINVGLKKSLSLESMENNTIAKTNTFSEIVSILKEHGAE